MSEVSVRVALSTLVVVLCGALAGTSAAASSELTATRLAADLVAGLRTTQVPSNLEPPLATAKTSIPEVSLNGCHLQFNGIRSQPCAYGDQSSATTVVMFGDSHGAAWFPGLNLVAKQRHWRLVDLTKAGCPPVEVSIRYHNDSPYHHCTEWRRNAMAQIAALHPYLVIVTWARWIDEPEARRLAGIPTGYGGPWQNGIVAMFQFLHRTAKRVIFLTDTPTLAGQAPDCLRPNFYNVYACTISPSAATRLPDIKREELALARREHVPAIDPISWFCTPTRCPVIVGNLLVFRDDSHMTPAWSKFIAPVLGDALVRILRS